MDDPETKHAYRYDENDEYDEIGLTARTSKPNRKRGTRLVRQRKEKRHPNSHSRRMGKVESRDGTFRCKRCKTMVGPPLSGGRHRNHCPLCLYSRHVDRKRPGDRQSECRSMMRAVGLFSRGDGEQVLVHECLGCGKVRHNRVAADDNVVETMRLPVIELASETGREEDFGRTA